jgi:SSU ribosomal protein S4E|uniref:Small ribosomal subunit protein eS4 n=1 Tax=Thermofilum pendens TaxID=2269 RepID=A0A7C3WKE9_THEPE
MSRKVRGSLRHLRVSVAPPHWPIARKGRVWTVKPSPGPHSLLTCIPLGIIIRDLLGYTSTMRETRRVLAERKVEIDGKVVTDYKYPVGLMDVIHIIPEEKYYRVVPGKPRKLTLVEIPPEEAYLKLLRVKNKTTVKGGHIQLTFHDGRNYLVRVKDPRNPVEAPYRTMDTVLFDLKAKAILEHVPFEPGVLSIVVDGRNLGFLGRIESIQQIFKRRDAIVTLSGEGGFARTVAEYVFPVGREKPLVTVMLR